MLLYRLSPGKYGPSLSGAGAAIRGGRWNSPGIDIIYTSSNRSLAMAEVAVHFSIATMPEGYYMMTLEVPDAVSIRHLPDEDLPPGWQLWPPIHETRHIGDRFIEEKTTCLLRVPSAVTPGDYNYLIHPQHPEMGQIRIVGWEPFVFDRRLFDR